MFQYFSRLIFFALHLSDYGVFPKTLSKEEEETLVARKMRGDKHAEKALVEHNLRLVAHVIKKYYADNNEQDDLISIGTIGLIKGIASFDPAKGARLATYAARCIENEILMYFRGKNKYSSDISISDPIETDSEGNPLTVSDILSTEDGTVDNMIHDESIQSLRRLITTMPRGRDKKIITLRYGLDGKKPLTQEQTAKKLGISRSYVSRIESRVLGELSEKIDKGKF
ncbi:MAG: RNA polymerase sporulation sigma factor SigK [Clostridia bacterium]|nr:RNA polymerase sporulation sigma factor SigK [Clostridia bacterium]